MNENELERSLRSWHRARVDADERAPIGLRSSLALIPQAAPAPGRPFDRPRFVLLAAALLTALLVGGAIGVGSGLIRLPSLVIVNPSPIPTPSESPLETAIPFVPRPGTLESGTYRMLGPSSGAESTGWPSAVIVTVPSGWYAQSEARGAGLLGGRYPSGNATAELNFGSVGNVLGDPCSSGGSGGNIVQPIGPSVEDLVSALKSLPVLEISEPVDVTLDGFSAKRMEIAHPVGEAGCAYLELWLTPPARGESWSVRSREGWRTTLWILDVQGLRFVVIASYDQRANVPDLVAEMQQMVDSIDIQP